MNKRLAIQGLAAIMVLIALFAYHYDAQRELKREIGRGYHINMMNIEIALEKIDYSVLAEMESDDGTYGYHDRLKFMLMNSDVLPYQGQPELQSLLTEISRSLSDFDFEGELTPEQQQAFNTNIRKVIFIISDFQDMLRSDLDWYKAFTNPDEKLQQRVQERLEMEY